MRIRGSVAAIVACVLFGTASGCASSTSLKSATTVVFVGDSLAVEAAPYLPALLQERTLVPKVFGGTAPCDWLGADLGIQANSVVVFSFIGNALTPCMADGPGAFLAGQAIVEKYRTDLVVLIAQAQSAGARVLLVGQPKRGDPVRPDELETGLAALYNELATDDVAFVDAGAAVENPDGTFAHELPCLPGELECDASGSNVVRSDDGVHFCPGITPMGECPAWSSGAFRFATAIADAIVNG